MDELEVSENNRWELKFAEQQASLRGTKTLRRRREEGIIDMPETNGMNGDTVVQWIP